MKIKLERVPYFSKDCTLKEGMEFTTIPCPVEHANLYIEDGVWVEHEGKCFRFFRDEISIIENDFDEKKEIRAKAFKYACVSKENLPIILDRSEKVYDEFINLFEKTCFVHEGRVYQPYQVILDYGKADRYNDSNFQIDGHSLGKRASFYVGSTSDIIVNAVYWEKHINIIFKEIMLPANLFKQKTAQEAVDGWANFYKNKSLILTGFSVYSEEQGDYDVKSDIHNPYAENEEGEDEENKGHIDIIASIKEKVLEKNQNKFLTANINNKEVKIPMYPFLIWLAPGYKAMHKSLDTLYRPIYGLPVSSSGMKMRGDSAYHNDWVIGAGLSIDEYYELEKTSNLRDEIRRLTRLVLRNVRTDFNILHQKKNEQEILFLDFSYPFEPGKTVLFKNEEDLLKVLKTIKNNGIVVSENGTEVAHIVNNATELDFTLIQCDTIEQSIIHLNKKTKFLADTSSNLLYEFAVGGELLSCLGEGNSKAHRLSKLKKAGFNVLEGLYFNEPIELQDRANINLIFRSSGEGNVEASGLFKSKVVNNFYQEAFDEVFNSFNSDVAKEYFEITKKEIKPAVLVQPFIKADESAVVGLNSSSFFKGDCSNIVLAKEGVMKGAPQEYIDLFNNIKEVLDDVKICEFIKVGDTIYVCQA